MRDILFRGKTTDGKWAKGAYVAYNWHPTVEDGDAEINGVVVEESNIIDYEDDCLWVAVIPETVGQYTGLTDKNGKKIFEGDILKIAKVSDGTGTYFFPPLDYPVNVIVKWDLCAWMWETLCDDKRYIGFPNAWCHYECEVIGNIHDNPELLKGGD